jgi:hypothetical protein
MLIFFFFFFFIIVTIESGLVLHTSTVVLTDERISHVGDPHAIVTSCPHVELVDVSSNVLSDWDEVCCFSSRELVEDSRHFDYLDSPSSLVVAACENDQSEL